MTENEKKSAEIETNAKPEKTKKGKKGKAKAKDSWRGFKSETKKIVWPTWKQVLKGTGVVLVVVIICAVAIGALDLTFSMGMDALINLFKK